MNSLPKTTAVIEAGYARQLHHGVQIAVFLNGELSEWVFGEKIEGTPLTSDDVMCWLSAGKPVTAVAIGRLYEMGKLRFTDRVSKFIPEFARAGKEEMTLAHLLTHTAGLSAIDVDWSTTSWDDVIARICEQPLKPNWKLGQSAGYDPALSWFVLGEVVQRASGHCLEAFLKSEIFETAGMTSSSVRGTGELDFAPLYDRLQAKLEVSFYTHRLARTHISPGSTLRGPARDLARFYQSLLNSLEKKTPALLQESTLKLMLQRHRHGVMDQTLQHTVDYGYGFSLDSNQYGIETVPYGFGRHAGNLSFGHGGSQSSIGFADPNHHLAVAVIANGRAGEGQHQRRFRDLLTALYEDLKVV